MSRSREPSHKLSRGPSQEDIAASWLQTPAELDQWLCAHPTVPLAVDTEFERVSTFFPIPGLVQLGLADQLCLVEPSVAEQSAEFRRQVADPARIKLAYAMSEDLELFRHWLDITVRGMLDLQIGAALAGTGYSVGYANMVEARFGATLDKSATRSDWLKRPLTEKQERYALDDVRYLQPLYEWVLAELEEKGLGEALAEESARFASDLEEQTHPELHYLKLRGAWRLSPRHQHVLQQLTLWRELECRKRDRPRGHVLADNGLISLAQALPANRQAMAKVPEVPPVVVRRYAEPVTELIAEAWDSGDEVATLIEPPLTREEQNLYRQAKKVLVEVADRNHVPMELLAPRKRLEALLRLGPRGLEGHPLAEGWRGQLNEPVLGRLAQCLWPGHTDAANAAS